MGSIAVRERDMRDFRSFPSMKNVAIVLSTSAVLALAFASYVYLILPVFAVKEWKVDGVEGTIAREILSFVAPDGNENLLQLDTSAIKTAALTHPEIAKVEVTRNYPGIVVITAERRKALLVAFAVSDGHAIPVSIDRDGVIFGVGNVPGSDLPVLSGVRFEAVKAGMKLPAMLMQLVEDVELVKMTDPSLLSLVSEIRIVNKGSGDYELFLFPKAVRMPVRLGNRLSAETLKSMTLVSDVLAREGKRDSVAELDFRTGTAVYREKENGVE